jgi:hypothetical protein
MSNPFLRALHARFDSSVLRAPQLHDAAGLTATQPALQAALQAAIHTWCVQGLPKTSVQLGILTGPNSRAKSAWAADFALRLDGSYALQEATGAAARLALRLRAKAQDAAWWRPRQASDFWDCGYIQAHADLQRFTPRRATLMLVDLASEDIPAATTLGAVQALWAQRERFEHTLRVLLLADKPPASWLALQSVAAVWHWP